MAFRYISFIFLLVLVSIAYFPSFTVPFYLDDFDSILNNQAIRAISWDELSIRYPMREIGYLSFALNYAISSTEVFTYHVVNFLLHLLMGAGVYTLTSQLVKLSNLDVTKRQVVSIALIAMGLFLLVPLNSQAVTYIVQRLAQLSAIFYLFGIINYIFARQGKTATKQIVGIVGLLFCFWAGLHAKQNIVTLPIAVLFIELLLFNKPQRIKFSYIFAATFAGLMIFLLADFLAQSHLVEKISAMTMETDRVSRWEYFTHQLSAVWIYVYKFFIPYPLLLEYGSTPHTWQDSLTYYALLGHLLVLAACIKFRQRFPVAVLLVTLYYVTHSVESSFIPISDLVFEHRAYLPNVFLAIGFACLLYKLIAKQKVIGAILLVGLFVAYATVTYNRNLLWNKPVEFYQAELTHVADNARSYGAVGLLYAKAGNDRKAERWFEMAVKVGAETGHLQMATIIQYITSLINANKVARANRIAAMALKAANRNPDKAKILTILSQIKASQGMCDFADNLAAKAKMLDPQIKAAKTDCMPLQLPMTNEH